MKDYLQKKKLNNAFDRQVILDKDIYKIIKSFRPEKRGTNVSYSAPVCSFEIPVIKELYETSLLRNICTGSESHMITSANHPVGRDDYNNYDSDLISLISGNTYRKTNYAAASVGVSCTSSGSLITAIASSGGGGWEASSFEYVLGGGYARSKFSGSLVVPFLKAGDVVEDFHVDLKVDRNFNLFNIPDFDDEMNHLIYIPYAYLPFTMPSSYFWIGWSSSGLYNYAVVETGDPDGYHIGTGRSWRTAIYTDRELNLSDIPSSVRTPSNVDRYNIPILWYWGNVNAWSNPWSGETGRAELRFELEFENLRCEISDNSNSGLYDTNKSLHYILSDYTIDTSSLLANFLKTNWGIYLDVYPKEKNEAWDKDKLFYYLGEDKKLHFYYFYSTKNIEAPELILKADLYVIS